MDSEVLEKALEASKAENPEAVLNGSAARPAAPAAPGGEQALWFAMLHGKQAGPLTRAELTGRVAAGEVGPRTYLWKEGMGAWQRAREVPELSALFPQAPEPSTPPPPVAQLEIKREPDLPFADHKLADGAPERTEVDPQPFAGAASSADVRSPKAERGHQELAAKDLFTSGETPPVKPKAEPAPAKPRIAIDPVEPAPAAVAPRPSTTPARPMFESAAPPRSRASLAIFVAIALAAAGTLVWTFSGSEKKEGDQPPAPAQAVPDAGASAPRAPPPATQQQAAPEKPPDAPPAAAPVAPAAGLTAEQVRWKLDDNKGALQSCIDEALHRDPNLRVGKIHIATTIAPNGQVTAAKIDKKTVDESPLGACLKRATKKIAFPSFGGDAFDVDIPIVVTAGE
jgi:hypothetical protein